MKFHRIIASLAALLLAAIASPPASALDVFVNTYDSLGTLTSSTFLTSGTSSTVNLDSDTGAAKVYGPFVIGKCSTCTGRPRVYVLEGSVDKLVLTDAQILNRTGAPGSSPFARMVIQVDSGALGVSGPAGDYPYAVELNGSFLGATPTDPLNRIQVTARTTAITSCSEGCFGTPTMIDSPATDAGETDATSSSYSVVAPPFSAGGVGLFGPKEQQNSTCRGWFVPDPNNPEGGVDSCRPALNLGIDISLKAGHAAKLPGSIGAFHVTSRCEPDNPDPKMQRGCNIMANFFASLGPKGFKVYDVRLEPSPGGPNIDIRGMPSALDAWVTKRGAVDNDEDSVEGNISNTRVRLQSSGVGDLRANGLCKAVGCDSSNDLPVQVYCADRPIAETLLHLNSKGDGKADLIFSVPCKDPAVLILDPSGQSWVAAPAIL